MYIKKMIFLLMLGFFLQACQEVEILEGYYLVNFWQNQPTELAEKKIVGAKKRLFAEVLKNDQRSVNIKIFDPEKVSQNIFLNLKWGNLYVKSSLYRKPIIFEIKEKSCWYTKNKLNKLCLSQTELELSLQSDPQVIWNFQFLRIPNLPAIKEKSFFKGSMEDLIKMSYQNNLDFLNVFENLNQARFRLQQNYLNLRPHFNMLTLVYWASPNFTSFFYTLGDLVPFLLPARWRNYHNVKYLYLAEKDAFRIASANVLLETTDLAYIRQRDLLIERKIENIFLQLKQWSVENLLDDQVSFQLWEKYRRQAKMASQGSDLALKHALGFVNSEIELETELNYFFDRNAESCQHLDREGFSQELILKSLELRQMDFLIKAAELSNQSIPWLWLDPYHDGTTGLGSGGKEAAIKIAQSELRQLKMKQKQIWQNQERIAQETLFLWESQKLEWRQLQTQVKSPDKKEFMGTSLLEVSEHFEKELEVFSHNLELELKLNILCLKLHRLKWSGPFQTLYENPDLR